MRDQDLREQFIGCIASSDLGLSREQAGSMTLAEMRDDASRMYEVLRESGMDTTLIHDWMRRCDEVLP